MIILCDEEEGSPTKYLFLSRYYIYIVIHYNLIKNIFLEKLELNVLFFRLHPCKNRSFLHF